LEIKSAYRQKQKTNKKTQWKATPAVEVRISELKDKMGVKEKRKKKTEQMLVKQLKSCERNIKKLSVTIKRQKLRIIGIEKERRGKTKVYVT
jgi:hypothetical protein